jgi:amino acid adenylation domain-containing protein
MGDDHDASLGFFETRDRHHERPAVELDGRVVTYRELGALALSLAATLQAHRDGGPMGYVAVLGRRSLAAYAGVLGALCHGGGYLPLNPEHPVQRNAQLVRQTGCNRIIVDAGGLAQLDELLAFAPTPTVVLSPRHDVAASAQGDGHVVLGPSNLVAEDRWVEPQVAEDDPAYIMFTSGSSGVPKGVVVTRANVRHMVACASRFHYSHEDRASQLSELVFDAAVYDLFVTWSAGACLCPPSPSEAISLRKYLTRRELTVWNSVPSALALMKRAGQLQPGAFPRLRVALIGGEALPRSLAEAFARAAPNAVVENVYGPTEATCHCIAYRWNDADEASTASVVPIGRPLPGTTALVVDGQLNEVLPGERGELLLAGPQLSRGYLGDPEKTERAFVERGAPARRFYRTGDMVLEDAAGELHFLGRFDSQIKVRGHRIELGEIEAALRAEARVDLAAAMGWPEGDAGFEGIVAFVEGAPPDPSELRALLSRRLPAYMVPREIIAMPALPLTDNGKVDRALLKAILSERPAV